VGVLEMPPDPWWARTLTVLDTETTGLDTTEDRIVSLALLRVSPSGEVEPGSLLTLVDPGVPVPAGAAAIHGITTERARADGIPTAEALRAAVPLLRRCLDEGMPLIIYNAPFDWPLVVAEAQRHGVTLPQVPLVDPLLLDRHFDRYRPGGRRLADVAEHYGVRLGAAHRAGADAIAAAAVARAIAATYRAELSGLSPADLHERQDCWYTEWRDSLNDYWARRGDPRRHTAEWPLHSALTRTPPGLVD
jgi:DNA polymerase-3 subunit epsilon